MQQLSLTLEFNLPNKLSASLDILEKVSNLYSADLLDRNRIRGIVSYAGLEWVCTGCQYHYGIKVVYLQRLLRPNQWICETYTNSRSCREANGCIYVGRLIIHRGVQYVIAEQRLELLGKDSSRLESDKNILVSD